MKGESPWNGTRFATSSWKNLPSVSKSNFAPREKPNPTIRIRIRRRNKAETTDVQCIGVMGRGGRRIRKYLLPRLQVCCGVELNVGEKVLSGATDSRFGDDTTLLEYNLAVM